MNKDGRWEEREKEKLTRIKNAYWTPIPGGIYRKLLYAVWSFEKHKGCKLNKAASQGWGYII